MSCKDCCWHAPRLSCPLCDPVSPAVVRPRTDSLREVVTPATKPRVEPRRRTLRRYKKETRHGLH
jgi:hypothetical protein